MIRIKNLIQPANEGIEDIMAFAYGFLGIKSDATVMVFNRDKTLEHFSTGDTLLDAILHKTPIAHTYNLVVREGADALPEILAHEMVHLSQYESGRLDLDMERRVFTWEGKEYPSSLRYDYRPWEREAFSIQRDILRSYKNINKQKRIKL